jgi:hypothetical protein
MPMPPPTRPPTSAEIVSERVTSPSTSASGTSAITYIFSSGTNDAATSRLPSGAE